MMQMWIMIMMIIEISDYDNHKTKDDNIAKSNGNNNPKQHGVRMHILYSEVSIFPLDHNLLQCIRHFILYDYHLKDSKSYIISDCMKKKFWGHKSHLSNTTTHRFIIRPKKVVCFL